MSDELMPGENIALTVALAQVERGDEVTPNIAAVVVVALARITGRLAPTREGNDNA